MTVIYDIIVAALVVLLASPLIDLFIGSSPAARTLTIGNVPLFTVSLLFLTIGIAVVNCFRDVGHNT